MEGPGLLGRSLCCDPELSYAGSVCFQEASPDAAAATAEAGIPVDRSTQTSSYASPAPQAFPPQALGVEPHTHLFSHLPLHSQQPPRSSYSMLPVGGIQLLPAGLAAYSTFVPIQAGPVQLSIPAVSIIHRNSSPLPTSNPPVPPSQPFVVQEALSSMLPCFPLGQLQPVGVETLGLLGLNQPGLGLSAALGLQVVAANPTSQNSTPPQTQLPGLQIVNIALPAIIPSLSPVPALSPLPGSSERHGSPNAAAAAGTQTEGSGASARSCTPPNGSGAAAAPTQAAGREESRAPAEQRSPAGEGREERARGCPAQGGGGPAPSWQGNDYNEASSDDEDRLVIAT